MRLSKRRKSGISGNLFTGLIVGGFVGVVAIALVWSYYLPPTQQSTQLSFSGVDSFRRSCFHALLHNHLPWRHRSTSKWRSRTGHLRSESHPGTNCNTKRDHLRQRNAERDGLHRVIKLMPYNFGSWGLSTCGWRLSAGGLR